MKTWVRKTLSVGVLAAGALLLAPGAAHADVSQNTSNNVGFLNGTQVFAPVAVPLNMVGNADALLGHSNAAGSGINWVETGKRGKVKQHSWNNVGAINGTQAYLPVIVPVNVAGNADSFFFGHANAAGSGVNKVEGGKVEGGKAEGTKVDQDTSNNVGFLNGTQIYAPYDRPINICGNALSILGLSNAQASCLNGGKRHAEGNRVSQNSSNNVGVLNGTQIYAPYSAPMNIAGNSIGVAGEANAAAAASNESGRGGDFSQDSSNNVGVLNGTQIAAPITIPVNICGNALAVLGHANASAACANSVGGHGGHHGDHGDHDGNDGDHGDDDGDYEGDHGDDDGEYEGDGGSQGDDGYYGDQARETHAKKSAAAKETGGVDGLTQNLSNAGGLNVGGLDVLDSLKN
jgi:hypothetical protein